MFAAYYRCLYGEDFIVESIGSVINHVDKVFVLLADKPWGEVDRCVYRGSTIFYPEIIDKLPHIVKHLAQHNSKIEVIPAFNVLNRDQAGWAESIIANHLGFRPNTLLFMEPDMVWREDQLCAFIQHFTSSTLRTITASQCELWRRLDYRVPPRAGRAASFLWDVTSTSRSGDLEVQEYVHNLGFCVSDRAMFWKHMLGIGISGPLKDSPPNEDWFEKVWLGWHPETNNRNLEISKGAEHNLSHAYPYPLDELPESIRKRAHEPWIANR